MSSERHVVLGMRDLIGHLDWRQELLGLAMVTAEAFPVYVVASFVLAPNIGTATFPFVVVAFLLIAAHVICRLLDELRIWSPEYEIKMVAAVIVSILIAVKVACFPHMSLFDITWLGDTVQAIVFLPNDERRSVWGVIVLGVYAWWRGRSRSEPAIDTAFELLRWGSLALVLSLTLILAGAEDNADIRDQLSEVTVGFFAAALAAVGIARLKLEGVRSSAPLGARWLGTFVVPIIAVVMVAIIAAGIFSRQFLDTVLWMLSPVFWVLGLVFQILVLIIAGLAFVILTPLFWLIGDRDTPPLTLTPGTTDPQQQAPQQAADAFNLPDPLRYLIAAIVLFVIFSLLTRYIFKRKSRGRPPTGEERESVLDWNDLLANAGDKLRGLFRRDPRPDPLAHLRGDDTWQYTLRIREAYVKLQTRGGLLGRERHDNETAEEYRPRVAAGFEPDSGALPAVDAMTDRYRAARYSGKPASAQDAEIAEVNWKTIERIPPPEQT